MQYKPHRDGLTEENELLLRSETNRPSADCATNLSKCLLQVVGDTTGVDKSTVSLAVHNADATLETHSAYSQEILLWDTNCRLARQFKWFLHHILTFNQRLTNLLSNRALNNVFNSSD